MLRKLRLKQYLKHQFHNFVHVFLKNIKKCFRDRYYYECDNWKFTYLLTYEYLLTPCSKVILEKLIGSAASQEISPHFMEPECSLPYSQVPATSPKLLRDTSSRNTPPPGDPSGGVVYLRIVLSPEEASHPVFLNMGFHGEVLLGPRPTPKLEGHPLSIVRYCLFNLFAATLHIGSRSSICNLMNISCRHKLVSKSTEDTDFLQAGSK